MNVPIEIIGVILAFALTSLFGMWWSMFTKLGKLDARLARIEAAMEIRWGIDIKELHKKKHEN